MAYDPKAPRFRKAKYSSQDVRLKALEARDELMAQVEFLIEAIREDRYKLIAYKEKHGDLRYRPVIQPGSDSIEPTLGLPTEVAIEPLASQYRATLNSFLQSIRLIQSEIVPEDNAEGESLTPSEVDSESKRASLRQAFLDQAKTDKTPIQPTEPEEQSDASESVSATKLVEKAKLAPKQPNKPATQRLASAEPKANPRPWRETTPRAIAKQPEPIETQSTPPVSAVDKNQESETSQQASTPSKAIGLSPALRASLGSGANRLDSIRERYRDGESRVIGKAAKNESEE